MTMMTMMTGHPLQGQKGGAQTAVQEAGARQAKVRLVKNDQTVRLSQSLTSQGRTNPAATEALETRRERGKSI